LDYRIQDRAKIGKDLLVTVCILYESMDTCTNLLTAVRGHLVCAYML